MISCCNIIKILLSTLSLAVFLGAAKSVPPHLDSAKVSTGCATCHRSANFRDGGGPGVCIICHGNPQRLNVDYKKRMPKNFARNIGQMKDIERQFTKLYRHPTFDVRGKHRSKEVLPEIDSSAPRHADCVDCHHHHFVSRENKYAGIKGKRLGNIVSNISEEYELCYLCHAESANLPPQSTNKRDEFAATNPSFHPVEAEGRNLAVVSLIRPYREKKNSNADISRITCGDCHGSDEPNAPKGPHGSAYQHILVANFSTRDKEPESEYAYALCYRCHNRQSILGNESFKFHALHISGSAGPTSCKTCHNSHGSQQNKYLIQFDPNIVTPNSQSQFKFEERGISVFKGSCYLSCHGVDHNPKTY